MINNEEWKDIPGIETHQASTNGRIRSKTRKDTVLSKRFCRPYIRNRNGALLRKTINKKGYETTSINNHTYLVHRLIAETFIPNEKNKCQVNHINGDKADNTVQNLAWCSPSENEKHSYALLGKVVWNKGKRYDTTNAVKARRKNHMEKCLSTYHLYKTKKMKQNQIGLLLNLSTRQVNERIRLAKGVV